MSFRLTHLAAGALTLWTLALALPVMAYDIVYDPNVYNYIGQSNSYLNNMLSATQSALDLLKKIYAKQLEQYSVQSRDHLSYNSKTAQSDGQLGNIGDLAKLFSGGMQGFNTNAGDLSRFISGMGGGNGASGVLGQNTVIGNGLGQVSQLQNLIGQISAITNTINQLKGALNGTAQNAALKQWTFQDFMKYETDKAKNQGTQSQTIFDQMKNGLSDAKTRATSARTILDNLQNSDGMNQSLQNVGQLLGLVIDGANAADRNNNVLVTMLNNMQTQQTLDRANELQKMQAQYAADKQYHQYWSGVFGQMANTTP